MRLVNGVKHVQQSTFKIINNMIAIQTRFHSATDSNGAKIVANAICGTKLAKTSIPYPYGLNPEQAHRSAALAFIEKVNSLGGSWPTNFVTGTLADNTFCHVLQH